MLSFINTLEHVAPSVEWMTLTNPVGHTELHIWLDLIHWCLQVYRSLHRCTIPTIATALVTSRLDYCNSPFHNIAIKANTTTCSKLLSKGCD